MSMLIKDNNSNFLRIYRSILTPFNNSFILFLLHSYKYKKNIKHLNRLIKNENDKIEKTKLTDQLIIEVCHLPDFEVLKVLLTTNIFRQQLPSLNLNDLLNRLYLSNQRDLLKELINCNNIQINYAKSELFLNIIRNDDLEMANFVISKGIYINYLTRSGKLLVWVAYELQKSNMVKLLIRSGADLFIPDTEYTKVLKLVMNDEGNIIPYLEKYYHRYVNNLIHDKDHLVSTLFYAIKNQNIPIIRHLLQTNTYHYHFLNNFIHNSLDVFENFDPELLLAKVIGNNKIIEIIKEKVKEIKRTEINKMVGNYSVMQILINAIENNELGFVKFLIDNGPTSMVLLIKKVNYCSAKYMNHQTLR